MRTEVNLCTCLNCNSILIDTNAKPDAKTYNIDACPCDILINHECPNCNTDAYLSDEVNEKRLAPCFTSTETTPLYWDCECIENYIKAKAIKFCPICKANSEDQPDSRIEEVQRYLQSLKPGNH